MRLGSVCDRSPIEGRKRVRRIAIINQKGGVGKTTTAVNLGAGLAALGKEVLLLDLDAQANLTLHLDTDPSKVDRSIYDVLRGDRGIEEVIRKTATPGLWLLPAHIDLAGAESELSGEVGRETLLRDALHAYVAKSGGDMKSLRRDPFVGSPPPSESDGEGLVLRAFDYVIIDCPPSLGFLSVNGLTAANEVLIPLQTQFFALQGMTKLLDVVRLVRKRLNPGLRLLGIVPCLFDSRTKLSQEVVDEVASHLGDLLLKTRIRPNVKLAEAPSHGKTIFQYAPESRGALDYMTLAREVAGEPLPEPEEKAPEPEAAADEAPAEPVRFSYGPPLRVSTPHSHASRVPAEAAPAPAPKKAAEPGSSRAPDQDEAPPRLLAAPPAEEATGIENS